jgi:hypothetical protein
VDNKIETKIILYAYDNKHTKMTKIHSEPNDYRILVDNNCDELQLSEYISKLKPHPNVLNPYACVKEEGKMWLLYKVSAKGTTLRSYILDRPQVTRLSHRIFNHHLTPVQTLLQLIDGYEFLLNNHLLTNQSNINPDYIWIDPDENTVFVINTIEAMTNEKKLITTFWSPEMLSKYNHAAFYDDTVEGNYESINTLASKLKRYHTRPSSSSTVYSLGLVMYFICAKIEPFEGTRVYVYEKPPMHFVHNERMKNDILIAINSDVSERPTLQQYREYLLDTHTPGCVIL